MWTLGSALPQPATCYLLPACLPAGLAYAHSNLSHGTNPLCHTLSYPYLHGPFRRFSMVTAFDTKGGFANINVGIVYTQNTSARGPVHGLFVEFERRVALGLRTPPPHQESKREALAVRFFWDQNLFNKVRREAAYIACCLHCCRPIATSSHLLLTLSCAIAGAALSPHRPRRLPARWLRR